MSTTRPTKRRKQRQRAQAQAPPPPRHATRTAACPRRAKCNTTSKATAVVLHLRDLLRMSDRLRLHLSPVLLAWWPEVKPGRDCCVRVGRCNWHVQLNSALLKNDKVASKKCRVTSSTQSVNLRDYGTVTQMAICVTSIGKTRPELLEHAQQRSPALLTIEELAASLCIQPAHASDRKPAPTAKAEKWPQCSLQNPETSSPILVLADQ